MMPSNTGLQLQRQRRCNCFNFGYLWRIAPVTFLFRFSVADSFVSCFRFVANNALPASDSRALVDSLRLHFDLPVFLAFVGTAVSLPLRCNERRDLGSDRQARQIFMADAKDLGAVTQCPPQMDACAHLLGDGRLHPRATAAAHDVKRTEAIPAD